MSWFRTCTGHCTDPTCFVDIHQDWVNTTRITKLNSHISEAYCQQWWGRSVLEPCVGLCPWSWSKVLLDLTYIFSSFVSFVSQSSILEECGSEIFNLASMILNLQYYAQVDLTPPLILAFTSRIIIYCYFLIRSSPIFWAHQTWLLCIDWVRDL